MSENVEERKAKFRNVIQSIVDKEAMPIRNTMMTREARTIALNRLLGTPH